MYVIRGNFFGDLIASSYCCPFLLALLLVQVPTPSFIAFFMLLVGDVDLFTKPFRSPTLPLLVLVAFCMRYIFLVTRGQGHSRRTLCSVDSWSGGCPVYLVYCCRFSLHNICCDILVDNGSVMSMVFDCGADDGVPSCLSCVLSLGNTFFPPRFRCRTLQPSHSRHRGQWRRSRMVVVAPAAATYQCLG